jgi:PAS domain S-box-containing protein
MLSDQRSFEQLLQESDTPMLLINQKAVIQDINPPATRLLGGMRDDYVGKEIFTLVDPADRYFLEEKWRNVDASLQMTRQFTVRFLRSHGPSDWHTLRVERGNDTPPDQMRLVYLQHLSLSRSGS